MRTGYLCFYCCPQIAILKCCNVLDYNWTKLPTESCSHLMSRRAILTINKLFFKTNSELWICRSAGGTRYAGSGRKFRRGRRVLQNVRAAGNLQGSLRWRRPRHAKGPQHGRECIRNCYLKYRMRVFTRVGFSGVVVRLNLKQTIFGLHFNRQRIVSTVECIVLLSDMCSELLQVDFATDRFSNKMAFW